LIDGHALIQMLGKPPGYQTFGEYAVFMQDVIHHFAEHTTRIDIVFDCYTVTQLKTAGKKRKPICKTVDGPMSHFLRCGVISLPRKITKLILPGSCLRQLCRSDSIFQLDMSW